MMPSENKRTKVFISYSHRDLKWLSRLQVHLRPLVRESSIHMWDDSQIIPGSNWREEIECAINSAKVAILLVSADFLGSEFISGNELPPLLEAARSEGARIIPVIVGPCMFNHTEGLSKFHAFNSPDKPLGHMTKSNQEKQFVKLAELIRDMMSQQVIQLPRDEVMPGQTVSSATQSISEVSEHALAGDKQKQLEYKIVALRKMFTDELSKYELLHLEKLAGESKYLYKISGGFRSELRRLRDKFGFIKNKSDVGIGGMPQTGDLKDYLEITNSGRRYIKMWQILFTDEGWM